MVLPLRTACLDLPIDARQRLPAYFSKFECTTHFHKFVALSPQPADVSEHRRQKSKIEANTMSSIRQASSQLRVGIC